MMSIDEIPAVPRRVRQAARLHDDPRAAAAAAGLTHVTSDAPGFTRVRHGRGFAYRDPDGRPADPGQRRRFDALAIPPAWTEVWICACADGHLQCTGFDGKGRKQYLYHERWRAVRDAAGFDRLAIVGAALPAIRAAVAEQLRRRTVDRARMLAGMVRLIDASGIRIGNEVYERENSSIGLTTLRWRHVRLAADGVTLRFPAKSRIRSEIAIADRPLARLLGELKAGDRQRVFRADGAPLRAEDLNAYLAQIAGAHVTAKDFRTWRGTVTALAYLIGLPPRQRATRSGGIAAIDAAAAALGNTRSVARAHYVHPGVLAACQGGDLDDRPAPLETPGLTPEERILLAMLPRLTARAGGA
jgi:DNA topoisomerase-1